MSFPPFKFFGEAINGNVQQFIKTGSEKFACFIKKQQKIRCFIPHSPGYGHQSATVNIIRRWAANPEDLPVGLGYAGIIEIWGFMEETASGEQINLKEKLFSLLPELREQSTGKINSTTIVLKDENKESPQEEISFGFCGADDLPNIFKLDYSKTSIYLMLQPYKWKNNANRVGNLSPGNLIFYYNSDKKQMVINLDNDVNLSSLHIADRGFYSPIKDLTLGDWVTVIENVPVSVRRLIAIIKTLLLPENVVKFSLVPIYGVNFPGKTAFRAPVNHRLALAMASFQTALRFGAQIKPPIIINFSPYNPTDDCTMSFDTVLALAKGGFTVNELLAAGLLHCNPNLSPVNRSTCNEYLTKGKYRHAAFDTGPGDFYKVVKFQDIIDDLQALLNWLTTEKNRILFIQGDRVPPIVFDFVLKTSGLLPIFEGNNTALSAISAGKPYFHTCDTESIGKENRYPQGTVNNVKMDDLLNKMQLAANKIQADFHDWPEKTADSANMVIKNAITYTYPAQPTPDSQMVLNYFGSIQEYFADPVNDKINISVSILDILLNSLLPTLLTTGDAFMMDNELPPLETLYSQIKAEVDRNATVNLLQDILKSGGIYDYFAAILKNSGGQLIVEKADVTVDKGSDNQITKVTLTGTTLGFGIPTECTLVFTLQLDKLSCKANFIAEEPWSLDGVPWIVFEKPTFNTLSSDTGLPPSGSISAILQGPGIELSFTLPDSSGRVIGTGILEKPATISSFMSFVGGINIDEFVPEPIQELANVGVKDIQFAYNTQSASLDYITLDIGTTESWKLLDRLKIDNVNVRIMVLTPGDLKSRSVTATLSGELLIGADDKAPKIELSAGIPGLKLSGQLASPTLSLNTLLGVFWPGISPPWPGGSEPAITELSVSYNGSSGDYMVNTRLDLEWPINIASTDILTIKYISLYLMGGKKWATGSLSGSFAVLPDSANIGLLLTASYLGEDAGWKFEAQQTSGVVDICDLLKKYLTWDTDLKLGIDGLSLTVETNGPSFEFKGKTADAWHIPIGTGVDITGNMSIGYNGGSETIGVAESPPGIAAVPVTNTSSRSTNAVTTSGTKVKGYYGQVSAKIQWNDIDLTVFGNFTPKTKPDKSITYEMAIGISWGILTGMIEEQVDKEGKTHQIATLKFTESTTLGSMIETMVSWVIGSKLSLGAPWDVLNKIPLSNFEFVWDFTDNTVKFKVNIGPIDLGFVTIKSIDVCYDKDPDEQSRKRVMIDLDASFIWGDKIPAWDATKPETTPAPQGSGSKYLDLRLLAMGQHVTFAGFKDADTVQKAIGCMENLPEPKAGEIPAITFDADSSWLFGADFGVLRIDPPKPGGGNALAGAGDGQPKYVLTLQSIFNDPALYALRIALDGDAAKIFKGLDFQIMYRKLDNNIGVYKAEIALPDIMRYLTIGAYSITLPVFGIEIYTSGDFKVDIGFPWNEDFSRSFTIEGIVMAGPIPIPMMGSGGIYFGKLPQIAASNVPAATNGHFNPILVFGFGAQIGLGKSIEYGILKAGFSLTVFGIIEGLLAKWNPYDAKSTGGGQALQLQGEYFFWLAGTVGIIGKIYGNVDFVVIKASVNITLKLYAQITLASYEPIPITIVASVEATASLTISLGLFKINLHFSFSVRIKETITIGALQNPADAPWKIESSNMAMGRLAAPLRERLRDHRQALMMGLAIGPVMPDWSRLQKPDKPAELNGYMAFALTVAGDKAFTEGSSPDLSRQETCYVSSLFIESVPAATQSDNSSALKAAGPEDKDTPFEKLAKLVGRWAIASIQNKGYTPEEVDTLIVNDDDLKSLLEWLDDPQDRPIPIPADTIETFLSDQVRLTISMPLEEGKVDAAFFPMALPLTLERSAYGDIPALKYTLGDYNAIQADFISWLRIYFDQLAVQVKEESDNGAANLLMDVEQGDISVASFVFADYFVLIMRQMLQAFREGLRCFKQPISDSRIGQTGNGVVTWVNVTGDMQGKFTLHDLFEGNAGHQLKADCKLALPGVTYTVQAGDTFQSIAALDKWGNAFDATSLAKNNADTAGLLADGQIVTYPGKEDYKISGSATLNTIASLVFKVTLDDLLTNGNIPGAKDLLKPFAILNLPPICYTTVKGDTLNSVAAAHGISIKDLSDFTSPDNPAIRINGEVANLFATDDENYNLVHLPQFQVGELIKEAQRTKALEHLSSMVSRYYFHGMHLPTDKITPRQEGMWVTSENGKLSLPPIAGLFALTGQQMAIPPLGTDSLTFSVTRPPSGSDLPWLLFSGGVQTLSMSIQPPPDTCKNPDLNTIDYCRIQALRTFTTQNALDTGLQSIGAKCMVSSHASTYPLSSSIPCQSATPVNYPTGGTMNGSERERLWYLPGAMLALPRSDAPETDPCPCFDLQVHRYDEATGATSHAALGHYGWTSSVEFIIKRLPIGGGGAAYNNTYEIMGADGQDVVLLERIVQAVKDNDGLFAQLILGYQPNTNKKDPVLRLETGSRITMGISQVNLSTVTRPPASVFVGLMAEDAEKTNLLNKPSQFVRLLWEASITRAGGFYLYYHDNVDGGLPDMIFNDKDEAKVTLIVLYASGQNNRLRSYMNAVLTGDPLDMSGGAVIAQAVSSRTTHPVETNDSLDSIATRYYSTVFSLSQLNPDMAFAAGQQFTLINGTYMVQEGIEPGGKLADIANYFAMKEEDIKDKKLNPRITDGQWISGLSPNTAIRLPKTVRTVGSDPGGTTLQSLADYYGSSSAAIASQNRFVTGLLASGQSLTITTGPSTLAGIEPPGVQTIGASCSALPDVQPDDPGDENFARNYLLYAYTMLGYSIVGNQDFIQSNIGLPLGPQGKPASDDMDKIRVAKPMNGTDPLEYSRAVPYDKLLSDQDGKPEPITNPYQANGRLLQINYTWNDIYGNRLVTKLDQDALKNGQKPKAPILTGYTDTLVGLSQWPGTSAHWTVAPGTTDPSANFKLTMTISFDPSAYEKPEQGTSTTWQTRAHGAMIVYDQLLSQLTDPNDIAIWFETSLLTEPVQIPTGESGTVPKFLLDWLTAIRKFLKDCKEGNPSPEKPAKSISLEAEAAKENINDKQIFKIDFQFIISRTQGIAEGDFAAIPAVQRIATPVTPITTIEVDGTPINGGDAGEPKPGLDLFAKNIENTLSKPGEYTLTVATGVDRLKADAGGSADAVWIVRLGESKDRGIHFSINDLNTPQIFAPCPVSNQLATQTVDIVDYANAGDFNPAKNTLTGRKQTLTFTDIELDKWVKQLFSAIDNLLSPEYVSSLLVIDQRTTIHPRGVENFLDSFKEQKKSLAKVAANLTSQVYETQKTTRLTSAQEALYQELLVKLSNLYSIRSMVSFGATVNADIPETGESPRLYGNVAWAEKSDQASQITLTSSKLDLQTGDDVALTFMVEAPAQVKSGSAGVLPAISLNLCFEGAAIEHQIAKVPGIEDYKASSWLTLIRPETARKLKAQLGEFQIPMFVRSFPLSPRMEVQTGKASKPESTALSDLTLWDYDFTYSQDFHYAQDRIYGEVEYNIRDNIGLLADFNDAFQTLAQFTSAQPNLEKLLKEIVPGIDATTSDQTEIDTAAKVLGAFLKMVTDVVRQTGPANNLAISSPLRSQVGDAKLTYNFYIEENERTFTLEGGTQITAWVVTIFSANGMPPAGLTDNPRIDIKGLTTQNLKSLTDQSKGIYAYWYEQDGKPLTGSDAQVIHDRTMVLPGIRILQCQDIKSTVYIKRNEELVKDHPSSKPFVYQTPEVTFSNPLHPTIASDQPVNIATVGNPTSSQGRPLTDHLTALFTELFKGSPDGTVTIQMEVSYGFTLNDELSDLYVPVPILMQPPLTCTIGNRTLNDQTLTLPDMINKLAQGIQRWFEENKPNSLKGEIRFKLVIMSNLTRQPMPLLSLTNLQLALGDIQPPL